MSKPHPKYGTRKVTATEARRSLSSLLDEASLGETIHILRRGIEVAVLKPSERPKKISEILKEMRKNPVPYPDEDFAKDVIDGINQHRRPSQRLKPLEIWPSLLYFRQE